MTATLKQPSVRIQQFRGVATFRKGGRLIGGRRRGLTTSVMLNAVAVGVLSDATDARAARLRPSSLGRGRASPTAAESGEA